MKRGLEAERLVQRYFAKRGYQLEAHRYRQKWVEIDLIMRAPPGGVESPLVWIEVKAVKTGYESLCLRSRQIQRLRRALRAAHLTEEVEVRCHLALVNEENQIKIFWDFLCGWPPGGRRP